MNIETRVVGVKGEMERRMGSVSTERDCDEEEGVSGACGQ